MVGVGIVGIADEKAILLGANGFQGPSAGQPLHTYTFANQDLAHKALLAAGFFKCGGNAKDAQYGHKTGVLDAVLGFAN